MILEQQLTELYVDKKMSVKEVASSLGCSINKVIYWMNKYGMERRTISEAIYHKHNPDGDPFTLHPINSLRRAKLYGLGIGLYWGEGTRANKHSIRLGNTDPALLRAFSDFLVELFGVQRSDFRFGLQLFTDIDPDVALEYWAEELNVNKSQFYRTHITISGSLGTYRKKSKYGVATLYYHNKKLRDILVGMLPR